MDMGASPQYSRHYSVTDRAYDHASYGHELNDLGGLDVPTEYHSKPTHYTTDTDVTPLQEASGSFTVAGKKSKSVKRRLSKVLIPMYGYYVFGEYEIKFTRVYLHSKLQ